MKELGIGVIGCGQWGPNHIRTLHSLDGVFVRCAADLSDERRQMVSRQYPWVETTDDMDRVINDDDVDAVVVATPIRTHHSIVKKALNAGKHVLCEKPLTLRSCDCEELAELAEVKGLTLMVGHVFMFNPGIVHLKEEIENGSLGRIYYLDAVRTNLGPIRQDVGATFDLASHDISIFNYLLDAEPIEVSAHGGYYIQPDREDMAFITFEYPDKTLCHVHVSWLNPRKVRQLTVVGDKKMAVWDDMKPLEMIRLYDKGLDGSPGYDTFGQFQMILRDADITIPRVNMYEPLLKQAEHFIDCLRAGRTPLADGRNGLATVRALEAAVESLRHHGRPVPIDHAVRQI